ncbi:MAG: hypothetical protein RLZZ175_106 [Bacteroidota bacterium]|jgi:hypothetical protein
MRNIILLLGFIFIVACKHTKSVETKFGNFEIAKIDIHNNQLQRIFVVINPKSVEDTTFIKSIIYKLKTDYKANKHTNISFFSDKKYADYKTELFIDNQLLPSSEIGNWFDYYYLGEYEFESNSYQTYPHSNIKRKKVFEKLIENEQNNLLFY